MDPHNERLETQCLIFRFLFHSIHSCSYISCFSNNGKLSFSTIKTCLSAKTTQDINDVQRYQNTLYILRWWGVVSDSVFACMSGFNSQHCNIIMDLILILATTFGNRNTLKKFPFNSLASQTMLVTPPPRQICSRFITITKSRCQVARMVSVTSTL